jgi:hypothetical protein
MLVMIVPSSLRGSVIHVTIKQKRQKSTSYTVGKHREYEDLMKGRFELTKVMRIERQYDPKTSTSFKTGDITPETIDKLIREGENDGEILIEIFMVDNVSPTLQSSLFIKFSIFQKDLVSFFYHIIILNMTSRYFR